MVGSKSKRSDRKYSRNRKVKRVFWGKKKSEIEDNKKSASWKKITPLKVPSGGSEGNLIIDKSILFRSIENSLVCKLCYGQVKFGEKDKRGLGSKIIIACQNCGEIQNFPTSPLIGEKQNAYEVNTRSVFAFRLIGKGYAGLSQVCAIMDFPPPVVRSVYDDINRKIECAAEEVANKSMANAAKEEIELHHESETVGEITVSGDGSWRKRGFSSLHGLCSVIGSESGKVIDVEVLSRHCIACEKWSGKEETPEHEEWYEKHKNSCQANYEGSAGGMEVEGMKRIFLRSEIKYGLKYTKYIGDGDAKTFMAVSNSRPYGNITLQKIECVGHVQKRMGTRLRKLKKDNSNVKLSDGKGLGGKGRLTDQVIDQFTTYYGNAIRKNSNSVVEMQRAIMAIYYHKISNDEHPQHFLCPEGSQSWCSWQRARATNKLDQYTHQGNLPVAVMERTKKIFIDLSSPELLKKCIGGKTQNNNESFNALVWKFVPKTEFSGLTVVRIGVFIAVAIFNDGSLAKLEIMRRLGITPGENCYSFLSKENCERIRLAELRVESATLASRQAKRRTTNTRDEPSTSKEAEMYNPGAF